MSELLEKDIINEYNEFVGYYNKWIDRLNTKEFVEIYQGYDAYDNILDLQKRINDLSKKNDQLKSVEIDMNSLESFIVFRMNELHSKKIENFYNIIESADVIFLLNKYKEDIVYSLRLSKNKKITKCLKQCLKETENLLSINKNGHCERKKQHFIDIDHLTLVKDENKKDITGFYTIPNENRQKFIKDIKLMDEVIKQFNSIYNLKCQTSNINLVDFTVYSDNYCYLSLDLYTEKGNEKKLPIIINYNAGKVHGVLHYDKYGVLQKSRFHSKIEWDIYTFNMSLNKGELCVKSVEKTSDGQKTIVYKK